MHLAGFSINIFTLAGLVIALGVVLDNAIVVVESVSQRSESNRAGADSRAIGATGQVATAVLAGTLTLLALFLPYLFISGITSLLFRELILVVAGVMVVSLLLSITLVPMLASLLVRPPGLSRVARWQQGIGERYHRLLGGVLRLRWGIVLLFASVTALAFVAVPSVGSEFLPRLDDGRVMVKVKLPTGTSLAQTDALLSRVEQEVVDDPFVVSAFTLAGGKVWGLYTFEVANEGQLDIQLVPPSRRKVSTQQFVQQLQKRLRKLAPPGGKVMVRQMRVKGIRKMGESDLEIQVRGPDLNLPV